MEGFIVEVWTNGVLTIIKGLSGYQVLNSRTNQVFGDYTEKQLFSKLLDLLNETTVWKIFENLVESEAVHKCQN